MNLNFYQIISRLIIIPLFTIGSIYSTNASGLSQCVKQIIQIEVNRAKNPN